MGRAGKLVVYRPIACTLHDELEAAATRGDEIELIHVSEGHTERVTNTRIVDIGTRGNAEYLRLGTGQQIRLDRVLEFNGKPCTDDDTEPGR
jgi:Rho-binding antiterminator